MTALAKLDIYLISVGQELNGEFNLIVLSSTNTTFQTAGTALPRVRVMLPPLGPGLELGNTNLASIISPSLLMLYEGTLATSWWWKWWWMWKLKMITSEKSHSNPCLTSCCQSPLPGPRR